MNNYLDFLSMIHEAIKEENQTIERKLREYNDGINRNVKDSRELAIADCENIIETFTILRKGLEILPMKKITEKGHG